MRALAVLLLLAASAGARDFSEDTVVEGGTFELREPWRITADGVTVDFGRARLRGGEGPPDGFTGTGLVVEGRKRVTIRGGVWSGFRCAILVKDCEEVVLEGVTVSGNFRQRLRSTPEREDPSDWLWPHENDEQQWRRNYGAGICLENSRRCVVRTCRGRAQQNGILLDRCEECRVYDNDMSFLSGWGLALWRSSRNIVSRNRFDWCVRGYSHGVYDRGQDSAGILVFEQCRANVFAYNSATHGGDGFFLYAGNQTLRRTGEGGCNDNLVVGNDFSHAVANAIEATFSRGNRFLANRCDGSNYGVWAGYSYETRIEGNSFTANRIAGVAIEHGWKNQIVLNEFRKNRRGVQLWWDQDAELLATPFGRLHGCESRDYVIAGNVFRGGEVAIFLDQTSGVRLGDNRVEGTKELLQAVRSRGLEAFTGAIERTTVKNDFPGVQDPFLPEGHPRGREYIFVAEWGPLDPTVPQVFPRYARGRGECVFHVLGARQGYEVLDLPPGLAVGKEPRRFRVRGGEGLTRFQGRVRIDGESEFPVEGTLWKAAWTVRFWPWQRDPRGDAAAFAALLRSPASATLKVDGLDFAWGSGAPAPDVPADRFATRAVAEMRLPAGLYELRTRSDDGVRVRVDGAVVQEDWTWHAPRENRSLVRLDAGTHRFTVEHFEIDGHAVLALDLEPTDVEDNYRGKYDLDLRFLETRRRLPVVRAAALARLGRALGQEVRAGCTVRFEDSGRNGGASWARVESEAGAPVLVLSTEHLVLGTHDLETTLVHELFHCLQRERLGGRYEALPAWAREGAALYLAGQLEERARALAAHPGPPFERLAPGLREPHALEHYALYAAAFDAAARRHGPAKVRALVLRLLATPDAEAAVRDVLGEDFAAFERAAVAHARALLERMAAKGDPGREAYERAVTLAESGALHEALEALRAVRGPVWIPRARLLELRILKRLEDPAFAAAAERAKKDLEPFAVYPEVAAIAGG